MAYTFGGATGDDINWAHTQTAGASAIATLVMGWWYPTTLTATRGLWSAGGIFGAEVAATTSEVILRTDNTTDGQWTTTGAGLTVNQWTFLAFLNSCNNSGPAAAWRVWSGTASTPPTECTVTQNTAPVGNFVGASGLTIGNKGNTGTVAWQGAIDQVIVITCSHVVTTLALLPLATAGTFTQLEADYIAQRFVVPYWSSGNIPLHQLGPNNDGAARAVDVTCLNLDEAIPFGRRWLRNTTTSVEVTLTVNGATASRNAAPRRTSQPPFVSLLTPGD